MSFDVPHGHYLVSHDYGSGGLWWFLEADSADEILEASGQLTVHDQVPGWMLEEHWQVIEADNLRSPKSEALRLILARGR